MRCCLRAAAPDGRPVLPDSTGEDALLSVCLRREKACHRRLRSAIFQAILTLIELGNAYNILLSMRIVLYLDQCRTQS